MSSLSRVVALGATVPFISCASVQQGSTTHDMECVVAAAKAQERSSDEKDRMGAYVVGTFYLGRLDESGLTLEQIQSGVDRISLSPAAYQETQKKEFSDQCLHYVNDRVNQLNNLLARDLARMRNNAPR